MSANLFLQYDAADTGGRPPDLARQRYLLDQPRGGAGDLRRQLYGRYPPTPTPIEVQVSLM